MDKYCRVISVTHQHVGVETRELFSLSEPEKVDFYLKLKEIFGLQESLMLITCNRAELYYFHSRDISQDLISFWCGYKAISAKDYLSLFTILSDRAAINHLYRVSVGLESKILGDIQIFGQVKQAYQLSADLGQAGTLLNRLMHKIFFCHKAINQETNFKNGAASVSYNAVNVLQDHVSLDAKILVIGAGQMGGDICRHLSKKGYKHIFVTNRSISKVQALAEDCSMTVVPYIDHLKLISEFEAVISTISCSSPVYRASHFDNGITQVVVDVSSPRSVHPEVPKPGMVLYNIDSLGTLVDQVLKSREEEIPQVEAMIDESIDDFMAWTEGLVFSDNVQKFKSTLEELRLQTMASMLKKMDEDQIQLAEEITQKMVQKIVSLPVMSMKTACMRDQEPAELGSSLNELFNLEYKSQVKS